MKLLIADDDVFFRSLLEKALATDYEIVATHDGAKAWEILRLPDGPRLAILDWVMPGLTGPQICRQVRSSPALSSAFLILLTAKNSMADVVAGLRSGADDYVTKPFGQDELRARVKIGERVLNLQNALGAHSAALENAAQRERQLQSLLPICPNCKRIRVDGDYWQQVDLYLNRHFPVQVAHGVCPNCLDKRTIPNFQLMTGLSEASK